ncbi:MAG: phenylalanine--tRNA ligase subunit beta, partial [Candidatus Saccharibacteria bacterium]
WLKDYVDINIAPAELAHQLTMAGIPVEGLEELENDTILELELTPNRGDCYGMINVAREVAAVTGAELHIPQPGFEESSEDIMGMIKVTIEDSDLCRRYAARAFRNIKIEPSPAWMQERLEKAGVRAINNIVDITNYVMLETNQPLHAFDYDLLQGPEIVVRRPRAGEKLATLDEIERDLNKDSLLICDANRPIALAGIMGGGNTEVSEKTTTMLLESANFHGVNLRRTAKRLGMRTEAAIRFEKGVDVEGVIYALDRSAQLIEMLGAGDPVKDICDAYPRPWEERRITLRPDRLNYVLGTELSPEVIEGYLKKLKFDVQKTDGALVVVTPSYRPDLEIEEDLIEEVARLYGYDKIPSDLTPNQPTQGALTAYQKFQDGLVLAASRYMRQSVSYSFINPRWMDTLLIPEGHEIRNTLAVANPFSEEQGVMRTTILPGLLETAVRNLSRRNEDLALFEIGHIFKPRTSGLPEEVLILAGLSMGSTPSSWQGGAVEMDFFFLKGVLADIFESLNIQDVEYKPVTDKNSYHPARTAVISCGGRHLGVIGELHPRVLNNLDIKKRVWTFELDVKALFEVSRGIVKFSEFSKFPAVNRDLALVVPESVLAADLIQCIKSNGGELLKDVKLFDVYRSAQLGEDKKSLAFSLSFQSFEGTLQEDQINPIIEGILGAAGKLFEARLR